MKHVPTEGESSNAGWLLVGNAGYRHIRGEMETRGQFEGNLREGGNRKYRNDWYEEIEGEMGVS